MNVLAINSATDAMGVALAGPEGCHEWITPPQAAGRGHSEALVPMVERLLSQAVRSVADLEGVAVVSGPGGFTGVRAGVVFAKAFAHARGLPVAGVDALEALAHSVAAHGRVVAMLDARRGMVFSAVWQFSAAGTTLLRPACLESLDDLLEALEPGDATFVGEGACVHRQRLEARADARVPSDLLHVLRPAIVADLALPALRRGGEAPGALLPRYLREPAMAREVAREGGAP